MGVIQIRLPEAEAPLKCPLKEVGERLGFKYIDHLQFETQKIFNYIIKEGQLKPVLPTALEFGRRYRVELKEGKRAPSEIRWINPKLGFGLFATADVMKGAFIGEYLGVICHNTRRNTQNDYLFTYPVSDTHKRPFVIDGRPKGNHCRFINHSPSPNLKAQIAFDGILYRIILLAERQISAGEQFFFNYGDAYWKERGKPEIFLL